MEELEQHYKIPEGVLNGIVSDEHLVNISTFLEAWKLIIIAPHFELNKGEIEAIENDGKSEEEKRLLMLQKWRQAFDFKATYKKLLEVLLTARRTEQAGKVCQTITTHHNTQSEGTSYMCSDHAGMQHVLYMCLT